MPRTRRHTTSSDPVRPVEACGHFIGPSTSLPPPVIDAQEQHETPVQQPAVETTEPGVMRGRKRGSRMWDVGVRGENGEVRQKKMREIDIFSLPQGERVIVDWNHRDQPVESSGGILAQFLGNLASNCHIFPIGYEKWQKMPDCYKDNVWKDIIKTKLEVNDEGHKNYIMKSLGKKWRDHRYHLYNYMKCDPDGPREANIAKRPSEIPLEQWVAFVDYRACPDIKTKAEQNIMNRTHLTTPHTLGSKSLARLENEMEAQFSRLVTRTELFQASHITSSGSFVNEEARRNYEELVIRSQSSSEQEAFTSIFGKDHPGYVRGMGLGVVPTQVYGSSSSSRGRHAGGVVSESEHNALKSKLDNLTQEFKDFKEQVAVFMARENQNMAPNDQENVGSLRRGSSQGSYSAQAENNSNRHTL